jgi:hypothetical protein
MTATGNTDAMTTNLQVKPVTKYNPADWFTNKQAISTDAERSRNVSFQVRQEARYLNNETENQTKWDTHHNNKRLKDRLDEIEEWRQVLRYQIKDIDKEIEAIHVTKNICENMLNDLKVPTDVVIENHATRDCRLGVDLVRDEPESELKKVCEVPCTQCE